MHKYPIPYGRQTITEEDIASVVEVLRSPFLTQGPVVPNFEQSIAAKVGAHHAVAVNSALHLACLALGLGHGDRLWTSPVTFVASANCGLYCGAHVDFVDVEPETGLMSVKALEAKLEIAARTNTLPKVLVPVHLCGTSCDMAQISSLAEHYKIAVVEDASHAIGAHYRDMPVGNCRYGAITVFSFHPVKIITTGEGGLATTNDPKLAQCIAELRSHGITKDVQRFENPKPGPWSYEQQSLGYNYRMSDLQAALGLSQLKRLDAIVAERNLQFERYKQLLSGLPVKLLIIPDGNLSSLHLAVIRLVGFRPEQHRRIFVGLRAAGIGVQLHYSPVHLQPYYRRMGFQEGDFPEAELYGYSAMSLPLFPGLTTEDQEYIVSELADLLKSISLGKTK